MSPEVAKLAKRAIVDYMAGNIGEFEELVAKAIEINKEMDKVNKCKYKHNGIWIEGNVNFTTETITGLDGTVLRKGKITC